MKEKLQNVYKETPERFRYAVESAIEEAIVTQPTAKNHLSKGWRIVIAFALIAALIPSTIFGASKLYQMMAKPVDNHGLEIDVDRESTVDYPKYVKMHVKTPVGFAEVPDTDGMKYYNLSAEEEYTNGFSLYPMRFPSKAEQKEYIENVDDYEERTVNGHQAYKVKMDGAWDRLYIYYEDVNVFLLIKHLDVTERQLANFINGISFTEGSASDFTYLGWPNDERREDVYYSDAEFVEYPRDTKITFKVYREDEFPIRCTAQIDDVKIVDNIQGLDPDSFNEDFTPDKIADENGRLLPRTYNTYKEGDDSESEDEIISSEVAEQKMILADITYENLSDEDVELCVPYSLNILEKGADSAFRRTYFINIDEYTTKYYITGTQYSDEDVVYLAPQSTSRDFYEYKIPAKSSCTLTVGWRCKADMVDKAYLNIWQGNVVDPEPDSTLANYLFKVQ